MFNISIRVRVLNSYSIILTRLDWEATAELAAQNELVEEGV